jgi:hypothetical protein
MPQPSSRAGKPINVGDSVTLVGSITTLNTGTPSVSQTLTVTLAGSGLVITCQAQDVAASTETL